MISRNRPAFPFSRFSRAGPAPFWLPILAIKAVARPFNELPTTQPSLCACAFAPSNNCRMPTILSECFIITRCTPSTNS